MAIHDSAQEPEPRHAGERLDTIGVIRLSDRITLVGMSVVESGVRDKARVVPVRLAPALLSQLDAFAMQAGTTRSAIVRKALQAFLAHASVEPLVLSLDQAGELSRICQKYGLATLEVFGSQARGDASESSDVDLLYTLKPGVRLGWKIEDLNVELAELFGKDVDLVARESVNHTIRDAVYRDARLIYAA